MESETIPVAVPVAAEWSTPLCAETPSCACCHACVCPCVVHTWIVDKASREMGWSSCNKKCLLCSCALCGCCAAATMNIRAGLRGRYRIDGDEYLDWIISCLCPPCALLQMWRQLNQHPLERTPPAPRSPPLIVRELNARTQSAMATAVVVPAPICIGQPLSDDVVSITRPVS
eukprot:TRINITY_DN10510_c0_g1_i1.p1 TRINITY_DN10510_c0_g1~~TRINITY_DN10510_c0_g1_i1.p1  ORF type:complete len:173 (-),score=9.60 TRINITY_DN10510_c0_g1_i1:309-827(-)